MKNLGYWVSDCVAYFVGSWWFILTFAVCMTLWVVVNTAAFLNLMSFDPYPFILLNLVLSTLAAVQAPFIMISQRRAEKNQEEAHRRLLCEIKELVEIAINEEQVTHRIAGDLKELVTIMIQDAQATQQIARELQESRPINIIVHTDRDLTVISEPESGSSGCSGS